MPMKKLIHFLNRVMQFLWLPLFITCICVSGTFAQEVLVELPQQRQVTEQKENIYLQKLKQPIQLEEAEMRLGDALYDIAEHAGLKLSYSKELIPIEKKVLIKQGSFTIEQSLWNVLEGTDLRFGISSTGQLFFFDRQEEVTEKLALFQETVTGTVIDAQNGEALPGVNVIVLGSEEVTGSIIGTQTDLDGNYSVTVPEGLTTLAFTYIGYQRLEVDIEGRNELDITLQLDTIIGEELVVVGFGTQARERLTGSISVKSDQEIENRPITSSTQALQGIQGVYVNQAGGQPGSDNATIRIRGRGTLNDNNPLILVDGIEYNLNQINPNNIESISVLKDASAAAIYGARAANGVVLITTKSGKGDTGFNIEYNHYSGFQQVMALPNVVTDPVLFMELRDQAQRNEGRSSVDYGTELIEEYRQGMSTDPYTYPHNDWFDIMFDPAFMHNHNLRFSGGADRYNYSLSMGLLQQDGVLMGTDAKKYTLALNTGVDVTDRLNVQAIIQGTFEDFNEPVGGVGYLMEMTLKAQGFHPTYLEDGRYADTFVRSPGHNIFRHPLVIAREGENNHQNQQYLATVRGTYQLPLNLTYNIQAGITRADNLNRRFEPTTLQYQVKTLVPIVTHNPRQTRHMRQTHWNNRTLTFQQYLEWNETIREGHQITGLLGFSAESFYNGQFQAYREGFPGNDLTELNAGSSNASVSGASNEAKLMSYFGRISYDYNLKYLFEANFRYDGSSKFAEGNRWGLFPSFAVGYRLIEEDYFQHIPWLSDLKIRASWGQLGNERVSAYRYLNTINLGQDYAFGQNVESGAAVTQASDPNVTWETTTTTNFGLESSFFRNKLGVELDLFHKRTADILRPVAIPSQVGNLGGPLRNIGTVDNRGIELSLIYRNDIGDFSYQLSGNVTWIKNEVVNLDGQEVIWEGFRGAGSYIIKEGYPIDSSYLLDAVGFFNSQQEIDDHAFQSNDTRPGYIKYRDVNGDGVINQDDRIIGPSLIPEYTYSFDLDLSYKAFHLVANFNGVQNVASYPFHIGVVPFWFGTAVTEDWVNNSWTPDNMDGATLPILTTYEGAIDTNFRNSNFWLRDASYLRLKNLQLSYTLPSSMTDFLQIRSATIFVNGQNLLTFSDMKDFDPERNLEQSNFYEYPSVKTFTAGFQLNF